MGVNFNILYDRSCRLILIMVGALTFNILTVSLILGNKNLRKNCHNLLILNISVADFGIAVTGMSASVVAVFDDGYFLKTHGAFCWVCCTR